MRSTPMSGRVHAIPTTYRNVSFRSRLEARWAVFFDHIGWAWEYEPLDLKGYIPDFIITNFDAPLLVEVKPAMSLTECLPAQRKIEKSGWHDDALVVCARTRLIPGSSDIACAGMAGRITSEGRRRSWRWSPAIIGCSSCDEGFGLMAQFEPIACLRCGQLCRRDTTPSKTANPLWAAAGNAVQYAAQCPGKAF